MKKYTILILLMSILLITKVNAQKNGIIIKRADRYYEEFDFSSALIYYIKADEKYSDNIYIKGRIGNCYKFLSNIAESEKWYSQVALSEGTDNIFKFYYAQSLMAAGKYNEALLMMNEYYESEGKPELKVTDFNDKLFEKNDKYEIKIAKYNSEYSDFSPLRIKNNLFFVSNRQNETFVGRKDVWTNRPFTQIFKVELQDTTNSIANLYNKEISKQFHEGPMSWDRKRNDLYITRSNYKKSKPEFGENKEVNLKIFRTAFVSEESDFGSYLVDNISFDDNNFSVCYPSITADGNYMIFSSDMPGGYGGLDLYVAENTNGIWSNPLNLGSNINTVGNESFPFIMPDGLLYFASDGHLGLGGYDIFTSELKEDGTFGKPVNLRSPINSRYDDFGIWVDDNYSEGFFSSNRPSIFGEGQDDIYSFKKESFMFEAVIYNSKTEEKIDSAKITLTNVDTKEVAILYTDSKGHIKQPIEPFSNYSIRIEKGGFLPEEAKFSTIDDEVYAEIPLVKDFGIVLEVTIIDADTKEKIPAAKIELLNLSTSKVEENTTNKFGKTIVMLEENTNYRLKASKKTTGDEVYLAVSKDFNTFEVESPANLFTTIELRKVSKNQEIKIDNIYYDLGKYYIRNDAKPELNKLIKILNDNVGMEIELSSHTDCRGSKSSNAKLSAQRAEAAVNYLIENGISYRRLTATGYGETKILNGCTCEGSIRSNCTEDEHQANRRTVFSILKFD